MAKQEKNQELIDRAKYLNHVPWCEQYEKMISGMLYVLNMSQRCKLTENFYSYDAWCEELSNARFENRRWCHKYNYAFPSNEFAYIRKFDDIAEYYLSELRQCLGRIGKESFIEPPFRMDYGANISIGERFYANFNLTILDCSLVQIGDRCMFGPNVSLYTATHETALTSRRQNVEFAFPITIGDDVWLGGNVTVLPGVTIGDGSVVAAGSIVTKDVPPHSVVKGSPARVFKRVSTEDGGDSSSGRNLDHRLATTM